ncbi:hypothetical protein ACFV0B_22550 [Streptomyces xanthophaeus]|uniref:hypothetical protein n=1 Tax=Streptomyces xanthophaeus TaxID=67385 RepID=UPI002F9167A2|nr:hypothetical protein OG264_38505 [Streptomyces xanthophaeus]WST65794.1 hypothetical protein OG605_40150 [Streptomyces xanthophaeus]
MNRQHLDAEAVRTGPTLHMPQQAPPVDRDAPSATAHLEGGSAVEPSIWWPGVKWIYDTITGG